MANYIHVPDEAPAVPRIDVTVDENDYRPGALKLIKELRPSWKPSEVKVKVPFVFFLLECAWLNSFQRFLIAWIFISLLITSWKNAKRDVT